MYGVVQKLLEEDCYCYERDKVLIESPFEERTRNGVYRDTVLLAITPNAIVIASEKNDKYKIKHFKRRELKVENFKICSVCPLNSINMTIFKRTRKQMLKIVFNETISRYYELGKMHPRRGNVKCVDISLYLISTRQIFWKLWCQHVNEIRNGSVIWPYLKHKSSLDKVQNILRWTDKYLYLGLNREAEDQIKPIPIPGLGRTEDIKLLYLKPEYFGCWDQSEHWVQTVQCEEEREAKTYEGRKVKTYDYEVYTYNEGPTSINITYNSLMTTVGVIGQF